jgi:HSP20 family molecular chaperone IbpA
MINMRCRKCGAEVDEKWDFCPRCGSRLRGDLFTDVFSRMEKELKGMDRMFERDFEVFDLSPFFRKPTKGRGFSIKITRGSGEKPKVSVKTFGDVNRKEIEEEAKKMGFRDRLDLLKPQIRETERHEKPGVKEGEELSITGAKTTEEPKTHVKRIGNKILVEVELPAVRNQKDIQVKTLENSIEIKARSGDKAYFKILTKPPQTGVVSKSFRNGILHLELG